MTHKDFDKSYEIRSSKSEDLNIKIPERITPGVNHRILDFAQTTDFSENEFSKKMVLLTGRDSNFFCHDISPRVNKFE